MIVERESNSLIKEWLTTHDPKYRIFEREYLEGRLAICREPDGQDKYWKSMDPMRSLYHMVREPNLNAYSELMYYLFSKYMPEASSGVEFGCGPQNSLHFMLPEKVKKNWPMIDVKPASVFIAKMKNPSGKYCVGSFSYPPIKKESQELVTGFNSFETTLHIEHIMGEMCSLLKKGGYILAMQDVIPSEFSTLIREYMKNGRKPVKTMADKDIPVLIETSKGITDVRSYHVEDLKEVGEELGMEPIFCGIVESANLYPKNEKHYAPKWNKTFEFEEDHSKNVFCDLVSKISASTDPDLPDGYVSEKVAVNAVVLKK